MTPTRAASLPAMEAALRAHFAELDLEHWWPARSRFERIAGAILVQNTAWNNVARALGALRAAGKLSLAGVRSLDEAALGGLIRSSGCWRQKARRLRGFVAWLDEYHAGSLDRLFHQPTARARQQLLAVHGIGEETADAILAFAGGHPAFILDAYTRRIFSRHHLPLERSAIFLVPASPRRCRELHALLVETAKRYCTKGQPACGRCPLQPLLP